MRILSFNLSGRCRERPAGLAVPESLRFLAIPVSVDIIWSESYNKINFNTIVRVRYKGRENDDLTKRTGR